MDKLWTFSLERTAKFAKRKRRYLVDSIFKYLNIAYKNVLFASELSAKDESKQELRYNHFKRAISALYNLQKPLWAYWNVAETSYSTQNEWCNIINREISLIGGVMKYDKGLPYVLMLDANRQTDFVCIRKISQLHKYTFQKICRFPSRYQFLCDVVSDFATNALYDALCANSKIPECQKDYQKRKDFWDGAIGNINSMQKPLISLIKLGNISNKELETWAELMTECIKLIKGVMKSDKNLYSNLE